MSNPARSPGTLYPALTYDDAPAAIEWLCRALGFTKRLVVPGPNGTIMHSELSLGSGVIMVSSPPEQGRISLVRGRPLAISGRSTIRRAPPERFERAEGPP
jgi:uncharacterized glyoxalase superfamily protein PhnB